MQVLKVKVISLPWPKVVYIQKFKPDFLRNYCADLNHFYESFQVQGNGNLMIGAGHMTMMAATSIYGKNPSKKPSQEPADRFPRNFIFSIGDSIPS